MTRRAGPGRERTPQNGAMSEPEVPGAALGWVAETVGGTEARVVRRMAGGAHAVTHLVETSGPRQEWVLRRYPPGDGAPAREARVLAALDGLGGRAPRLAGVDPEGRVAGAPATLITRLPGRADLAPGPPGSAAAGLGRALARVHGVPVASLGALPDATPTHPEGEAGPTGPTVAAYGHQLTEDEAVLTHYDFWSGNVLWEGGALTGIVDWSGGGLAPRGHDVSWCRLDLALLHGPHAADAFLAAYEREAATAPAHLWLWDLSAVARSHRAVESWRANYQGLGRADLTGPALRARHADWASELMRRYGELVARA